MIFKNQSVHFKFSPQVFYNITIQKIVRYFAIYYNYHENEQIKLII
jgi:hypothetical protein